MLGARRRYMGGDIQGMVPIEYLEANAESGVAWIDTGFVPTGQDIDIYFDFTFLGYSVINYTAWFGANNLYNTVNQYSVQAFGSTMNRCSFKMNGTSRLEFGASEVEKRYNFTLLHSGEYTINEKSGTYNPIAGEENTRSLRIFTAIDSTPRYTYGRLHSFRLDKDAIPVLDLIPVRIEDTGYMFDRVSGQLFGNSGTGRFVLGPDLA